MRLRRLLAHAADRLPAGSERYALLAASRLGQGPVIGLPRPERVLCLAPHPDDESIGSGGLLARLSAAGVTITVAWASDGAASRVALAPDEIARRRRAEGEAAATLLGVRDTRWLGFDDGRLSEQAVDLGPAIVRLLDELRPDLVVAPWWGDGHADHVAVATALADAIEVTGTGEELAVWGSEVWTPAPITHLVEIDDVLSTKQAALDAHATGRLAFDLDAMLALNRYRSLHGLRGRGHAEGYVALSGSGFVASVRAFGAAGLTSRTGGVLPHTGNPT